MERAAILKWVASYARAWEHADPKAAAALFTDNGRYWSFPFSEPAIGRDGIHDYWSRATSTQSDTRIVMGSPIIDDRAVAVEWWGTWVEEDDGPITLPGVLLLRFEDDGRVSTLRENWMFESGHTSPFEGWGEIEPGDTELTRERCRAFSRSYEAAWRRGDAPAAANLYAPVGEVRTGVLRPPLPGRARVLQYTSAAFGSEKDQDPGFGEPLASAGTAAVEWWCRTKDEGKPVMIAGTSILTFDDEGLVVTERDYWNWVDEPTDLYPGWTRP